MDPIINNGKTLDDLIDLMGTMCIGDVVALQEGTNRKLIVWRNNQGYSTKAGWLVCRLYTDAIFNGDIRCIQTIINRVDGGLPKDTEVAMYRTSFADCLDELMEMPASMQTAVDPNDSVMMVLAKSLYDLAVEDIYWDNQEDKPRKPSDNKKMMRDTAMRMVLDRIGGRKTKVEIQEAEEEVDLAPWIKKALKEG